MRTLLVFAVVTATASAQADELGSMARYRAESVELKLGFYGAATLLRGGQDVGFSHFGTNADVVFTGEAADLAETYRDMRIAGFTLSMVGVAVLMTELVLILTGNDAVVDDTATGADGLKPLTFVLLGSGLGLSLVGIGLEFSSLSYLSDAVRVHNAELAARLSQSTPSGPGLRLSTRF